MMRDVLCGLCRRGDRARYRMYAEQMQPIEQQVLQKQRVGRLP